MSKVYLIRNTGTDYEALGREALRLLQHVAEETNHQFAAEVPIKVHFGEKGNNTFMPARCYTDIINYLQAKRANPSYIETNVLYRGPRTTSSSHIQVAKDHGFTQVPIIIADGETGTDYDEIEINKDYFSKCKIGKAYSSYKQFIVTSHFKGHIQAGFGGSLKQLSMGFAARGGKLAQHSGISPVVNGEKCISCGICVEKCDFNAISLSAGSLSNIADIDQDKCIGCAGCIAVCPEGAIKNTWGATNFLEKIAEYAYGAAKDKDNIYITFIHNITRDCDCIGREMTPITDNIGIVAGKDPVALDTACLDLVQQNSGEKLFESGRASLCHAQKIGLGSMQYQIIEL